MILFIKSEKTNFMKRNPKNLFAINEKAVFMKKNQQNLFEKTQKWNFMKTGLDSFHKNRILRICEKSTPSTKT